MTGPMSSPVTPIHENCSVAISIRGLTKRYGKQLACNSVDLEDRKSVV